MGNLKNPFAFLLFEMQSKGLMYRFSRVKTLNQEKDLTIMGKLQKKAVIVGGSNGIGLALGHLLIEQGYFIEICDRVKPEDNVLKDDGFHFNKCNLLQFDNQLFRKLALDLDVKILIITAGIGRIADFEFYHTAEIDKTITINSISTIKVLRLFYERIRSKDLFYTGVLGSIAGWLCSPAASVYSASKAAVVRFIESVNIELEANGYINRILDVSPSAFKGSRFYGGKNDLSQMEALSNEIINQLFLQKTLFIPSYKEIFEAVLERYKSNPHEYGLHSYEYKKASGRVDNSPRVKIGYLSGTFSSIRIAQIEMIRRAKEQCDYLIIGVRKNNNKNNAEILIEEQKELLASCKYVDQVVDASSDDKGMWSLLHFNRLFVAGREKVSNLLKQNENYSVIEL